MSDRDVDLARIRGVMQVARATSNFMLLKSWEMREPVLLKRGLSSTVKEFIDVREYITAHGKPM